MTLPTSLKRVLRYNLEPWHRKLTFAAAALPQTSDTDLWTVTGQVKIHFLAMKIATTIQAQATGVYFDWLSTDGAESHPLSLASGFDINGFTAGNYICVVHPGVAAANSRNLISAPPILEAGNIRINTLASSTGTASYEVWWSPVLGGSLAAI